MTILLSAALTMASGCGATATLGEVDTEEGGDSIGPGEIDCASGAALVASSRFQSIYACDDDALTGEAIADNGWLAFHFTGPALEEPLLSLGGSFDISLPSEGWYIGLQIGYNPYVNWCDLCDEGESSIPPCSYAVSAGSLQITYEPGPPTNSGFATGWISGTASVTLSDGTTSFPFEHSWDRTSFRQVGWCD